VAAPFRLEAVQQVPLTKAARHAVIVELLEGHPIASQTELGRLLAAKGVPVTQATVSRDIRELGLLRVPGEGGARYAQAEAEMDEALAQLEAGFPTLSS